VLALLPPRGEYPLPAGAREERRAVHHAAHNHLIFNINRRTLPKERGVAISMPCGQ